MIDDIFRNTEFLSTFLWKIKARRENCWIFLKVQACFIIAFTYLKTWVMFYLLVSGHRIKHSVSCLAYYDSVFLYQRRPSFSLMSYLFSESGYQIKWFQSCLTYFFPAFGYEMKHSFSCLIYYFSELGHQMKHFMSCLIQWIVKLDSGYRLAESSARKYWLKTKKLL